MKTFRLFTIASIILTLISACEQSSLWGAPPLPPMAPPANVSGVTPPPTFSPTIEPTRVPQFLWISPAVPDALRQAAQSWGISLTLSATETSLNLDVENPKSKNTNQKSIWIYALAAPFPTIADGVSADDIKSAWNGSSSGLFGGSPLILADSTLAAFTALWGEPAQAAVKSVPADQLLDTAWAERPSWAIIPFEAIEPRWKVLTVDGQSPIQKSFSATSYPLAVNFELTGSAEKVDLPATNRDPSKMTTLIMTGVTALVRLTAVMMNSQGVLFPGKDIRGMMLEADITHISNEVPFYSGCPQPDPKQEGMVFCSATRYMELLTDIGTDVVELTGNHFADFGPEAMQETLEIYKQNNIPYYGGGADLADSLKPLLLENHGNKIAFIGCNQPDVGRFPTATEARPGAAPCDFNYMSEKIKELSSQGYLVIATFQWSEGPQALPYTEQVQEFQHMADSGAVIVSGSQAHVPQIMEFRNGAFIHYGLGNLFFDQMEAVGGAKSTRREFIDRHVFYDGRYLGVELITTFLEDFSRPRFMTPAERESFLEDYFMKSGW